MVVFLKHELNFLLEKRAECGGKGPERNGWLRAIEILSIFMRWQLKENDEILSKVLGMQMAFGSPMRGLFLRYLWSFILEFFHHPMPMILTKC